MKLNFEKPWIAKLFAIVIAVLLFSFVNLENRTRFQSTEPTDGASITSTEIVTNLPIEVNIDTDHYFVSGIPDSATLRIEGPQAIIFQTVATQGYTISTPNLNTYGEGAHTIELQVEGLSDSISAGVSPAIVNLTIEEKEVQDHELSIEVSEDLDIASGYELTDPSLSTEVVQLSGAKSTMAAIDRVVVEISSDEENIKSDILMSGQVLVLDEDGNPLNVNASPSQVEINAPVVRTQKEVPVVLREGDGGQSGYEYEMTLSNAESESVIVRGDSQAVSELQNFPITVNFDGITESQLITIPITEYPEGIEEIDRDEIEVLIEVTQKNNNNRMND